MAYGQLACDVDNELDGFGGQNLQCSLRIHISTLLLK